MVSLTNRQREAIFLRFYEDLSYEEIAELLEMNLGGTYKLIYRALDRLRDQLGDFSVMVLALLLGVRVGKRKE
ncbi:RNA polymerase sigma factor [compost metagenome]